MRGMAMQQAWWRRALVAVMACWLGLGAPARAATDAATRTASSPPPGWQHGAFMEIFVRAYQDSDGDGIGDLRGLISRLDYLQRLGIRGIWLMPVSPSADHDHGYATTDYRGIEPDYGTLADFDELLRQAHARGIGVITDYVINHSAATHPLFLDAIASKDSKVRDWYVWSDTKPTGWDIWGKDPWTETPTGYLFATFGPHMPDFNFRNPLVLKYHEDNLRFWLSRGIDGFRFDAAPHLVEHDAKEWNDQPESRRITRQLVDLVSSYGDRYSVCEATANPVVYGSADVCGAAFGFGYEHRVARATKGDAEAIAWLAHYFETAPPGMATMVSNHDIFAGRRLWDQVGGDEARYRLAAATYLLAPGTPYIYYGEEIGMAGIPELKNDKELRTPMTWTRDGGFSSVEPFRPYSPNRATHNAADEQTRADSLLAFYRAIIGLRNAHPAIARGEFFGAYAQGTIMSYQRRLGDEHLVMVYNYGTEPAAVDIPAPADTLLLPVWPTNAGSRRADARGRIRLTVPALNFAVMRVAG